MSIDRALASKLAQLAALGGAETIELLDQDLTQLIEFASRVSAFDGPLPAETPGSAGVGELREDVARPSQLAAEALANAPLATEEYFVVPPMIEP